MTDARKEISNFDLGRLRLAGWAALIAAFAAAGLVAALSSEIDPEFIRRRDGRLNKLAGLVVVAAAVATFFALKFFAGLAGVRFLKPVPPAADLA